jgi:hypothetical protein
MLTYAIEALERSREREAARGTVLSHIAAGVDRAWARVFKSSRVGANQFLFGGIPVKVYSVYWLYWYKSTNTASLARCLVYLLDWYKGTDTDAEGAAPGDARAHRC